MSAAHFVAHLLRERRQIERMMQHKRTAAEEPRHQRKAHAGKRGGRQRRLDDRILRNPAFEQDRKPARQQFGMTARDRHAAAFADIEGDRRDMGGGIAPAMVGPGWRRLRNFRGQQVGERHYAVRKIFAEAAHITDGEDIGGDVHGALGVVEAADAVAGDDCLGADAGKRGRRIGAAIEQRQGGDDHPRPQHGKRRQKVLDGIGQLNADDRICRQSHVAQPRGNGGHNAIGFGVGEAMRVSAGKTCAVTWIDERKSVRPALRVAAENIVERERGAA
jgi:hypothetical protein